MMKGIHFGLTFNCKWFRTKGKVFMMTTSNKSHTHTLTHTSTSIGIYMYLINNIVFVLSHSNFQYNMMTYPSIVFCFVFFLWNLYIQHTFTPYYIYKFPVKKILSVRIHSVHEAIQIQKKNTYIYITHICTTKHVNTHI